jgi:hypothetical protein
MSRIKRILSEPLTYLKPTHIINNVIGGRLFILWRQLSPFIKSDSLYLKVYYRLAIGRKLDLRNPKTFTEKIQWLKLHNTDLLYSKMVDKYQVREIIGSKIGEEYLVPLLGVYNSFDEIDINQLPNQFALKTTHDSGTVCVCDNKSKFHLENYRTKFSTALKRNYFYLSREYPYRNAIPRIVAEEFLVTDTPELGLVDYKFFCFNGEPKFVMVVSEDGSETRNDFFDLEFNTMDVKSGFSPRLEIEILKPKNFEKMIQIVQILAQSLIFIRIDLYNINGKIYFGEYTFHHNGGVTKFDPEEENLRWGKLIKLNYE